MSIDTIEGKKRTVEVRSRIREFVFGIQDALISTVGLLAGVQNATQDSRVVIISGIAAAFTGALSMATGTYLSSKAQNEIFEKELKDQEKFVEGEPYLAQEGLLDVLRQEGLSRGNAYRVVNLITKEKGVFIRTFQEKVLGIGSADISKPLQGAFVMYLSFVMGAFVPISPYLLIEGNVAVIVSSLCAATTLFFVGVFKSYLAKKSLWLGGLEFFAVAVGSAVIGWFIGSFFN